MVEIATTSKAAQHHGQARHQPTGSQIARERIARSFARAAQHYDAHALLQREVAQSLLAYVPDITPGAGAAPQYILDLGCGTGYCSQNLKLQNPHCKLYALDIAEAMVQQTMQHSSPPPLGVCADALYLPFAAHSFDLVVSSLSLQWCGDPVAVFNELVRVLKPGASAVLSTFGPDSLQELREAWAVVDNYTHVNGFDTRETLQQAARAAGLALQLHIQRQTRWYRDLRSISVELKGIGAHNMNPDQPRGLTGTGVFRKAEARFARGFVTGKGIPVTYEIFYLELIRSP